MTESDFGPIERQVRADVEALMTEHPMGESIAEIAFSLARDLDEGVAHTAKAPIATALAKLLEDLARLGVDSDELGAELSVPQLPA